MEIKRVKTNKNGAMIVVVPKSSEIKNGDFVTIQKLELSQIQYKKEESKKEESTNVNN